jgi:hypothetical protein
MLCSHLIQLILEANVLGAIAAVVVAETTTLDLHVLAHVYAPRIVAVSREETLRADLDAVRPDVVVVVAVVPGVCVAAHRD